MIPKKKALAATVLLLLCLLIHLYSKSSFRVENGYTIGFFQYFSGVLRGIFGWIPFSFGDILYGLLVGWLIWKLSRFLTFVFRKKDGISKKPGYIKALLNTLIFCSAIYIVFNVFWGINYNRKGIAWQLGLKLEKYNTEDLKQINSLLTDKINASKKAWVDSKKTYPSNTELFRMVAVVYEKVSGNYPFLQYHPVSIKSSLWGWLGNYMGFTGYYNPFTAEAQLNTTVPKFLHPFITCHEVAHQLGYAKEMEANFVGYLSASNSGDPLFEYSVYLDLFIYANRNLYFTDSTAAKTYRDKLSTDVVADLKEWIKFNKNHRSFIEPISRWIYGLYLQGNQQPSGVLSYDEVTGFLIAYYKKFGRI